MTDAKETKRTCPEASVTWWRSLGLPCFALLTHFPPELQEDFIFCHIGHRELGALSTTCKLLHNRLLDKIYMLYMNKASKLLLPTAKIYVHRHCSDGVFRRLDFDQVCWSWFGENKPNSPGDCHARGMTEHFCTRTYADANQVLDEQPPGYDILGACSCEPIEPNASATCLKRARSHIVEHQRGTASQLDAGAAMMRGCARQFIGSIPLHFNEHDWHVYSQKITRSCRTLLPHSHRGPPGQFSHLRAQKDDPLIQKQIAAMEREVTSYKIRCRVQFDKATLLASLREVVYLPASVQEDDISITLSPDPEDDFHNMGLIWPSCRTNLEWKVLPHCYWPQVVSEAAATMYLDVHISINTVYGTLLLTSSLTAGAADDLEACTIIHAVTGEFVGAAKQNPLQTRRTSRRLREPLHRVQQTRLSNLQWIPNPKPKTLAFHGNQSSWRWDTSWHSQSSPRAQPGGC